MSSVVFITQSYEWGKCIHYFKFKNNKLKRRLMIHKKHEIFSLESYIIANNNSYHKKHNIFNIFSVLYGIKNSF